MAARSITQMQSFSSSFSFLHIVQKKIKGKCSLLFSRTMQPSRYIFHFINSESFAKISYLFSNSYSLCQTVELEELPGRDFSSQPPLHLGELWDLLSPKEHQEQWCALLPGHRITQLQNEEMHNLSFLFHQVITDDLEVSKSHNMKA